LDWTGSRYEGNERLIHSGSFTALLTISKKCIDMQMDLHKGKEKERERALNSEGKEQNPARFRLNRPRSKDQKV